jgi:hypothetical protein
VDFSTLSWIKVGVIVLALHLALKDGIRMNSMASVSRVGRPR